MRLYSGTFSGDVAPKGTFTLKWTCTGGLCTLSLSPAIGSTVTFVDVGDGAYAISSAPSGNPCDSSFVPGFTGQLVVDSRRLELSATTQEMRVQCSHVSVKNWPSWNIGFSGARQ